MSRLSYFLPPQIAFSALQNAGLLANSRLISYRSNKSGFSPTIEAVDLAAEDLATKYLSGRYCEYYLSLGSTPDGPTDWTFLNRSMDELLLFEGGRNDGTDLEITKLRIFAKKSRARLNFTAVKCAIRELCPQAGLETLTGVYYQDIHYSNDVATRYRLQLAYLNKDDNFTLRVPAV